MTTNGVADKAIDINEWVVAITQSGQRLLGRLEDRESKDLVPSLVFQKNIRLCPAFELLTAMSSKQVPGGGSEVSRVPIVLPLDFTVAEVPVYTRPTAIYFCAEMAEVDKRAYLKLVEDGSKSALQLRAQQSGLQLLSPR